MGLNRRVAGAAAQAPMLPHRTQPWYRAYMEALFEYDRSRIGVRILEAEVAIHRRRRRMGDRN